MAYFVEVEGFTGQNRIFDYVEEDNRKKAVDYAKRIKQNCLNQGYDNRIIVEKRYYEYREVILEL